MKTLPTKTKRQAEKMQEIRRNQLPARPRLGIDVLESRELFAGNVLASLTSQGILQITGDSSANCVWVDENTATGQLRVMPCAGDSTKINGVSAGQFLVAKSSVKVISIGLLGGNDSLGFGVQGGVTFDGPVNISMGSGHDKVTIDAYTTIKNNLKIYTSSGDDTVRLNVATVSGLTLIDTGIGKDKIKIESATNLKGNLSIDSGAGADQVHLQNSQVGGTTSIKTGDDSDVVCLDHTTFAKKVDVLLGSATGFLAFDVLDVHDSTFQGAFVADGETGGDIYDSDNNTFAVLPVVSNFESYADIDCNALLA